MSDFGSKFVALVCPQCGGKVEVEQTKIVSDFVEVDDTTFVYMGATEGGNVRCTHCKTEFARRQRLDVSFEGTGRLDVNTGGGAFIGGHVTMKGGDFVGRDSIRVIRRS